MFDSQLRDLLVAALLSESISEEINRQNEEGGRTLNILLAEDVHINVVVATTILRNFGYTVDIAENGLIALDKLRQNGYDLVLMDCQMPEMDGYQCTLNCATRILVFVIPTFLLLR